MTLVVRGVFWVLAYVQMTRLVWLVAILVVLACVVFAAAQS